MSELVWILSAISLLLIIAISLDKIRINELDQRVRDHKNQVVYYCDSCRIWPGVGAINNEDLIQDNVGSLIQKIITLRKAIRTHRDQKGHKSCWLNDNELYANLPEKQDLVLDRNLPAADEFISECVKYWQTHQPPKI